jgi:hypothetical protein
MPSSFLNCWGKKMLSGNANRLGRNGPAFLQSSVEALHGKTPVK